MMFIVQSSNQSLSYSETQKPKQTFQISSQSTGRFNNSQGLTFSVTSKPKQTFEISHQSSVQPSIQSLSFTG